MRTRNLIIALVFAGVTAWALGQCVSAWAGDAGRQGETTSSGARTGGGGSISPGDADFTADTSSLGGFCGCQGTDAPLSGRDVDHDPDVTSNDPTDGGCGCVP